MKLLQELLTLTEEDKGTGVSKTTRAVVYHADYVKTRKKKYRKYDPSEKHSSEKPA